MADPHWRAHRQHHRGWRGSRRHGRGDQSVRSGSDSDPAVAIGSTILALQIFGPYELIRNVFRWFALALLAYVGSAILAKPDLLEMLRGTLIPTIQFTSEFLAIVVAVIGTTLSAYL